MTAAAHAEEHTWKLARLAESAGKSRIALHLAGTSMKEYRELTRRLSEERTQYQAVEFDAKREASQARREAWDLVKQSRFAEPLGAANQPVSDHVKKVTERLVGMRLSAVRRGHNMDKRDRDSVGLITQKAGELRGYAAGHRTHAADVRGEKALRATIAKQFCCHG
ncbi:hypothetical protein [Streptomyces sp. NPDC005525]|uniref:hypothetical protein n=1 Tax=Streptomyces sp. NPDC005525 TaxID=3364720 RepID=UPI0036A83892